MKWALVLLIICTPVDKYPCIAVRSSAAFDTEDQCEIFARRIAGEYIQQFGYVWNVSIRCWPQKDV